MSSSLLRAAHLTLSFLQNAIELKSGNSPPAETDVPCRLFAGSLSLGIAYGYRAN